MTRLSCSKQGQASRHKFVAPAFLPSRQSGISLIEAMISVLLIAVTAVGLAYVSSRSMLTQRYVTTQNLAVIQMREQLKSNTATGQINFEAAGSPNANITTVNNSSDISLDTTGGTVTGSTQPISIGTRSISTVTAEESKNLFGGDGIIKIGGAGQ